MHRRLSASILAPLLALPFASATQPAAAQDARACVNEVDRLTESFFSADGGDPAGTALPATGVPSPSAQEKARDTAQAGGVVTSSRAGQESLTGQPAQGADSRPPIARLEQQPGARQGAFLDDDQRKRVETMVQQARTAGERGDGGQCIQKLAEARALLRQAGLGSTQPGSPAGGGDTTTGTAGAGAGVGGGAGVGVGAMPRSGSRTTGTTGGPGTESFGGTRGASPGGVPNSSSAGRGGIGGNGGSAGGGGGSSGGGR